MTRRLLLLLALASCTPAAGPARPLPHTTVQRWWHAEADVGVAGVVHSRGGELLPGAVVIATSPALPNGTVVLTDEHGVYRVPLAPGEYLLTVYSMDTTAEAPAVIVRSGGMTHVDFSVDLDARPEVIRIQAS